MACANFSLACVARKVLACAVVLLIIGVSVYAVVVVLRPGELTVSVVGGSLSTSTSNQQQVQGLYLTIELCNDGSRGTIYYTGVIAELVMERKAAARSRMMNITLGDIIVEQQSKHTRSKYAVLNDTTTTTSQGKMFFSNNERKISPGEEVDVILHGNLTTHLYALGNHTTTPTTYTCHNVTVAAADGVPAEDVPCHLLLK